MLSDLPLRGRGVEGKKNKKKKRIADFFFKHATRATDETRDTEIPAAYKQTNCIKTKTAVSFSARQTRLQINFIIHFDPRAGAHRDPARLIKRKERKKNKSDKTERRKGFSDWSGSLCSTFPRHVRNFGAIVLKRRSVTEPYFSRLNCSLFQRICDAHLCSGE